MNGEAFKDLMAGANYDIRTNRDSIEDWLSVITGSSATQESKNNAASNLTKQLDELRQYVDVTQYYRGDNLEAWQKKLTRFTIYTLTP